MAEQTHSSCDIYHVASFTHFMLGYYISPRAGEWSLLLQHDEISYHWELLDSPPFPNGKEKRRKNVSYSILLHLGELVQMNESLQHSYLFFLHFFILLALVRPTQMQHNPP